MNIALKQRREQVVGDCSQLKKDVDSYNENWNRSGKPVTLVLDFTNDVAEREAVEEMDTARHQATAA